MFNTYNSVLLCMTDDKSLLRCTIVKSLHTTERLVVYVAWMVVSSAIVGCIGCIGYLGIPKLVGSIGIVHSVVATILSSIPIWVYGAASIPIVIVLCSFLWCVARNLTVCDWDSDEADSSAAIAAIATAIATAIAAAAAAAAFATAIATAAFATAIVAIAAAAFAAADYNGTTPQKIVRFVGACLHYCRRIKSEKSK